MTGPIIAVLDGSPEGEAVIPLAVQFAQRSGARLHLTYVLDATETLPPRNREQAGFRLRALVDRCAQLGTVADTVILERDPIAALLEHITRERASLTVTMSRTPPTLRRVFSENVADGLIRFASAPVLVCSPSALSRPGTVRMERILIALDGSELAEHALQAVRSFAADSEIILLQAICSSDPSLLSGNQPPSTAIPLYFANQRRVALDYLNQVADQLRAGGFRVSVVVTEGVWPGPTIVRESVQREVGLLAMATHGRTGFARRALGSCAAEVLRLAPMPVLVAGPNLKPPSSFDSFSSACALEAGS